MTFPPHLLVAQAPEFFLLSFSVVIPLSLVGEATGFWAPGPLFFFFFFFFFVCVCSY